VTARPWWRWHERAVVVLAEMVWIGGAAAHGVGTHFNVGTPAMALMYSSMGVAAILLTSATTTLAWAIDRSAPGRLPPALKSGLV